MYLQLISITFILPNANQPSEDKSVQLDARFLLASEFTYGSSRKTATIVAANTDTPNRLLSAWNHINIPILPRGGFRELYSEMYIPHCRNVQLTAIFSGMQICSTPTTFQQNLLFLFRWLI